MENEIETYKFLFDIRLMGASSVLIRPLKIPIEIDNYPSNILYVCDDGFVFEKRIDDIYYRKKRIIIPPFVKDQKIHCIYTFDSCMDRYNHLKLFKRNLIEFTKSKFFGNNPYYSRVVTYQNYWYVH
ncbi:MAG: hypothetical protein ACOC3V_02235 [bacterium]